MEALRSERGSISIWAVGFAMIVTLLVGLAVDVGGQITAQQEASDAARQSARAGGQAIDEVSAMQGQGASTTPEAAAAEARQFLAGYDGMTGTVTVKDEDTIEVRTKTVYQTKFLGLIGIGELPVSGQATARVVTVMDGTEQ